MAGIVDRERESSTDRVTTIPMKSLVALATEKVLLKTSGRLFMNGIVFMKAAGLAPDRVSVLRTEVGKYILQFHSMCDIRPFAANYSSFARILRGLVHVRDWKLRSIEFKCVPFHAENIPEIERTIEKLGVELVMLSNCTYPGVAAGEQSVRFLMALNRKKRAVVCEYGDVRLKSRLNKTPVEGQADEVVEAGRDDRGVAMAAAAAAIVGADRARLRLQQQVANAVDDDEDVPIAARLRRRQ